MKRLVSRADEASDAQPRRGVVTVLLAAQAVADTMKF